MQEVKSSMLTHVGHDPMTNKLTVRFTNGGEYVYDEVTEDEYKDLMEAKSIGAHFAQHIRPHKKSAKAA